MLVLKRTANDKLLFARFYRLQLARTCLQTDEPCNNNLSFAIAFITDIFFILPEDGTLVPKHVADTPLIFIIN